MYHDLSNNILFINGVFHVTVEIRRRTMAEELVILMGGFPAKLCEIALERSHDNIEYAATWLLDHGHTGSSKNLWRLKCDVYFYFELSHQN